MKAEGNKVRVYVALYTQFLLHLYQGDTVPCQRKSLILTKLRSFEK